MTPPLLTPHAPPRDVSADAPALPVRAPLARDRAARPPLLGRRAVVGSLAAHAALAVAVWVVPVAPVPTAQRASAGTGEAVSYLDLGDFPGVGVGTAGGAAGIGAFPSADSLPQALPASAAPSTVPAPPTAVPGAARPTDGGVRFPTRTPSGIPGPGAAPGGRAGGGGPGTGAAGAGTATGAGGAGAGQGGGGGGRFQPGFRDPRLYAPRELPPEAPPSDIQRYREQLQARLDVYNDSVAEAGERDRRTRNWTFQGKDGKEWGIAEGGVPVVAGRRIPLPVAAGVPIPRSHEREDEARERARELRQIDRQAQDQDRDRYIRERNRATRERQDSIRRARKP